MPFSYKAHQLLFSDVIKLLIVPELHRCPTGLMTPATMRVIDALVSVLHV
jgi:hypothetical protein